MRLCPPTLERGGLFTIVARHTSFQSNEEHFRPILGTIEALIQRRGGSFVAPGFVPNVCYVLYVVFAIVVDNTPLCYVKDLFLMSVVLR